MSKPAPVHRTSEATAVLAASSDRLVRLRQLFTELEQDGQRVSELAHRMAGRIFLIGVELTAQKSALSKSGSGIAFGKWCEENISSHDMRTLQRWMKVSHAVQAANNVLGDTARSLLTNGEAAAELDQLGEQVFAQADAETISDLYRWAGAMPSPKKPEPRAKTPRKPLTPEQKRKAEIRDVLEQVQTLMECAHVLILDKAIRGFALLMEDKPAEFKALRLRLKNDLAALTGKLDRIK